MTRRRRHGRGWLLGAFILLVLGGTGGAGGALLLADTPLVPSPVIGDRGQPPPPDHPAPFTGLALGDPGLADRPAIAVKVDAAEQAGPPVGLGRADVVVATPIEDGETRFTAVYQSDWPREVGPVRSAREHDADLVGAFAPVLATSGAAAPVRAQLAATGLTVVEEGRPAEAWWRVPARPAPHNLFVDVRALAPATAGRSAVDPGWRHAEVTPARATDLTTATLVGSAFEPVTWTWEDEAWQRSSGGVLQRAADRAEEPAEDAPAPVTAANVIVLEVATAPGAHVDAAGNTSLTVEVLGEGDAWLLRGGARIEGRWQRPAASAPLSLTAANGTELPLQRGPVWIEVVPAPVALEPDAGT